MNRFNQKLTLLIMVFAVSNLQANILVNPGFEKPDEPIGTSSLTGTGSGFILMPSWTSFEGSKWNAQRKSDGWDQSLPHKVVRNGKHACIIFWIDSGFYQDFAAISGNTYNVGAWHLSQSLNPVVGKDAVVSIEWYDSGAALLAVPAEVGRFVAATDPVDVWKDVSGNVVAPIGAATGRLVFSSTLITTPETQSLGVFVDDTFVNIAGGAKNQTPSMGETVVSNVFDLLEWENPTPGGVVSVDVFFGADPNTETQLVSEGVGIESVSLSGAGVSIEPSKDYYFRVDIYEDGTPTVTGLVWHFDTNNSAPSVVIANLDPSNEIITWLTAGEAVINLDATVVDDGITNGVTYLWEKILHDGDLETIVSIDPNNTVDTTVTINGLGYYQFRLTADDSEFTGDAVVGIHVFADVCAAVYGDQYWATKFVADFDKNCTVDINDLRVMGLEWLECMSPLLGCAP